jgi:glutaconate CoA-transferase subunit B
MSYRPEELLISTMAGLLDGAEHVAVGAVSPIPGAAALLARARSGGLLRVSLLGSERHSCFTDGGRELFDCAAQGRIDVFFLGGAQIDGTANVNLVGIGGYPRSDVRLSGSFGSAYLSFLVPRVILFQPEHSTRTLVPRVDFVSAPGVGPPGVHRVGGPVALVTGRCVLGFDRSAARFHLASVHPGQTVDHVREHTGFDFDVDEDARATPAPDEETLALLRGEVGREIAETYPVFAARVLGVGA